MQTPARRNLRPSFVMFLKLTAVATLAIVLLVVLFFLLKIVIVAAVVAAVLMAGYLIYKLFRRGPKYPVVR